MRTGLVILLVLTFGLGHATYGRQSSTAAPAKAVPEKLTADTPRVTAAGATFTVPAGWSITTEKNLVLLEPPETDTHIALVDSDAADARSAVAAGWAAY